VHGFTGGGRKNRLYEWLQVRAYHHAQGVVAVSSPLRELLERRGVPGRVIQVIPNAWMEKPALGREEARSALAVSGNQPLLGWVGRLSREKGADVFLEALALLPDIPWHASVLGIGREQAGLESRAAALGLANRITWHGLLPGAARYFPAFDLFVLSSRTEGTPIALFEAMAAEVPIVATSVGGVPDVVTPVEAALVPPEDPRALAAAIRATLTNPESARRRAEAARRRLSERFATGPWLDAHERMYRQLVLPPPVEA
jgi:glycosyltransferase involved in cell wall biosynthesis